MINHICNVKDAKKAILLGLKEKQKHEIELKDLCGAFVTECTKHQYYDIKKLIDYYGMIIYCKESDIEMADWDIKRYVSQYLNELRFK